MIDLVNFSFDFGGRYLYQETDFFVKPKERIGLVGLNGTGKSTLLRIITGEYSLTGGSLSKPKDLTIGFLNQDLLSYETDESIFNVALQAFSRVLELEKELNSIYARMETDHSDSLMSKLSEVQTEYESLDGYNIHHKTAEVLEGLGFETHELEKPLKQFSGGWRMRVMLGKLLLQNPNLLLLDEPTNHLDLPSIQWLEEYIKDYDGSVIVVSHDRYFLDNMVTRIAEVANARITSYPGNYSNYIETKAEREEIQQKAYDNQQAYIRQQERFIERFKAKASKATLVKSREKALDKIERVEEVSSEAPKINLRFEVEKQSGKTVSELKDVKKAFGDKVILNNSSIEILRGDKIALIGANGRGKSTMLRIIAGTEPVEGLSKIGHNVIPSFYAQHQLESLNVNNTLLEELASFAQDKKEVELRTVLGCFLFTGDDVHKKIRVLSGGEKARVALAKTLISKSNFLLLDEPTNHLDMNSISILIQALQNYEGSFIVVSHDRYFVSQIANKIWWIEDQVIREYPGTYEEYNWWVEKQEKEQAKIAANTPKPVAVKAEPAPKPKNSDSDNDQKLAEKKLASIEKSLNELDQKKQKMEMDLANPEIINNNQKYNEINKAYKLLLNEISSKNAEYEELFNSIIN